MTGEERDEKALAPEYATFSRSQRDELRRIACQLIVLAAEEEATRAEVMMALEAAAKSVSGMHLGDFRARWKCPGCLNDFTSKATMRQHYEGRSLKCIDPMTLPQLEQKTGGRWGWSAKATEFFKDRAARGA